MKDNWLYFMENIDFISISRKRDKTITLNEEVALNRVDPHVLLQFNPIYHNDLMKSID